MIKWGGSIPYPNIHVVKINDGKYDKVVTEESGDSGVQIILGVKDGKTTVISYHFDKNKWTMDQVKDFIERHSLKPIEVIPAINDAPKENESGWDGTAAKNSLFEYGKNDKGELVKSKIEKYFLSVTGQGLVQSDYSFPVGKVVNGKPQYDLDGLTAAFVAAMGARTKTKRRSLAVKAAEIVRDEFGKDALTEGMTRVLNIKENAQSMESVDVDSEKNENVCASDNIDFKKEKTKLIEWARNPDDNRIEKYRLMKYFMDVDGGDAQDYESYRYPVAVVTNGEPQYCNKIIDMSWDLAAGKETGIANRNIQKKLIFLKNREGMNLNDDQSEFIMRHMESNKNNNRVIVNDAKSSGGIDIINVRKIKFNESIAGSKIIYEDDNVIDVPVVPMREGVFTGTDGIPTLKLFEHFSKDAHWLEGQPILRGHLGPNEIVTYKHNRIGKLMNVIARPDKKDVVAVARYYKSMLTPSELDRIKSGIPYDGSIAYTTHTKFVNGKYNGVDYNAIEDGGYHFYHFAELPNGIGACSVQDGCGFMLNSAPAKDIKVFYNDVRKARVVPHKNKFRVKLNSDNWNGLIIINDGDIATKVASTYVRNGNILMNKSNKKGNNMTEEIFVKPDEMSSDIAQKMNEFEQKLNERDAKIVELEKEIETLLQKQNEAILAEKERQENADFNAFRMRLNAANRNPDVAKKHYEGFKTEGWSYFDKNPGILMGSIPKMNKAGVSVADGDGASSLAQAREMLRKNQKERFGKKI